MVCLSPLLALAVFALAQLAMEREEAVTEQEAKRDSRPGPRVEDPGGY